MSVKALRRLEDLIFTVGRSPTGYRLFGSEALWCPGYQHPTRAWPDAGRDLPGPRHPLHPARPPLPGRAAPCGARTRGCQDRRARGAASSHRRPRGTPPAGACPLRRWRPVRRQPKIEHSRRLRLSLRAAVPVRVTRFDYPHRPVHGARVRVGLPSLRPVWVASLPSAPR